MVGSEEKFNANLLIVVLKNVRKSFSLRRVYRVHVLVIDHVIEPT